MKALLCHKVYPEQSAVLTVDGEQRGVPPPKGNSISRLMYFLPHLLRTLQQAAVGGSWEPFSLLLSLTLTTAYSGLFWLVQLILYYTPFIPKLPSCTVCIYTWATSTLYVTNNFICVMGEFYFAGGIRRTHTHTYRQHTHTLKMNLSSQLLVESSFFCLTNYR